MYGAVIRKSNYAIFQLFVMQIIKCITLFITSRVHSNISLSRMQMRSLVIHMCYVL